MWIHIYQKNKYSVNVVKAMSQFHVFSSLTLKSRDPGSSISNGPSFIQVVDNLLFKSTTVDLGGIRDV